MSFQHHFAPYITDRELQVALLVFAGNTSKEIATILNCQKCTVEAHRKSIRTRFRVKNIMQLRKLHPGIERMKPGKGRQYPKQEN